MDIDRFIALNQPTWHRLDELSRRASTRSSHLTADELDELLTLYQRVASQLSHARAHYRDAALTGRLTETVARANSAIYGRKRGGLATLRRFFSLVFPAAVWHCRVPVLTSSAALLLPAAVLCLWLLNSPEAMEASGSTAERARYVHDDFEQYYSASSPLQFFAEVTVNNIWVSFLAFAGAATGGLLTLVVLIVNSVNLGVVAAWMIDAGEADRFWGFILPHGMLELTAIVITGGAALRLGWTIVSPGDRTRADALAEEGQRTGTIVLGVTVMFLLAGLIEGFITGRGFPPAVRVGIGAIGWVAAIAYIVVRGRDAEALGITGRLGEDTAPRPTTPVTAATTAPVPPA